MKKITYFINCIIGTLLGSMVSYAVITALQAYNIVDLYEERGVLGVIAAYLLCSLVFSVILVSISGTTTRILKKTANSLEGLFVGIPTSTLLVGSVGLILGLLIALLLNGLYSGLPWDWLKVLLSTCTYMVFAYLGVVVPTKRRGDIMNVIAIKRFEKWDNKGEKGDKTDKKAYKVKYNSAKVLDTSVIIDGRILDVLKSGFLEGDIIISDLVLNELRHIADEGEQTKRIRGRRGLDIVKEMQQEFGSIIIIISTAGKFKEIDEVDEKLVFLAKELGGKIVTNDYNLNKMSLVHKVDVLNVNELAQNLRSNVLSGEKIDVNVLKQGREKDQGLAYLDDGTMIVIENGRSFVGSKLTVEITSVIQTASGRMIFAVPA